MKFPYRLVDVFSATPFRGNPLAVVLDAQGLDDEVMQRITRWFNLSETAFLLPPSEPEADYRVRIFTLDRELPFAGHPTLGSCRAWLSAGNKAKSPGTIVQQCGAGLVPVRDDGERLAFAAPPLVRSGPPDDATITEVCEFLSLDPGSVVDMAWIDNGPGWLGVLLPSAADVLAVETSKWHPRRIEVGLVGPCAAGTDHDFEVRALFSDQHGAVREDPVTGSLNAAIAQWLIASGRTTTPYVAAQGQRLGRRGRVHVHSRDDQVWVGGATRIVVDGVMRI